MQCPKCGKEIANDSAFCEFCGAKLKNKKSVGKYVLAGIGGLVFLVVFLCMVGSDNSNKDASNYTQTNASESVTEEQVTEDVRTDLQEGYLKDEGGFLIGGKCITKMVNIWGMYTGV